MTELKRLSKEAIPTALDKAVRYRLLNDPEQAESICLDVLEVEPDNENALINLLLALTDQFEQRLTQAAQEAQEVLERLTDEYHRIYYAGIIYERRARALLKLDTPRCHYAAHDWYQKALEKYGQAAKIRPEGNDEAILRWNTCVRALERNNKLKPEPAETFQPFLE